MPTKGMVMTEMQKLKIKKTKGTASLKELTRLKVLQDGEPLSVADLENAKKREEERVATDKATFETKKRESIAANLSIETPVDTSLNVPAEHPRMVKMKEALLPFTQIEAHDSRPDDFILFNRGINITAGDVRKARKAMEI